MGTRADKTLRGLAIQSRDITLDTLADVGVGSLDSAYVAQGPRPGQATTTDTGTRIEPVISGGQSQPVDLIMRRGGMPERRGAEVLWRLPSESADDSAWRGWNPPNMMSQWAAAVWDTTNPHETHDLITTHDDQQLILLYIETTTAEPVQSKTFDFDATEPVWSLAVSVSVDPYDDNGTDESVSDNVVAGVALPSGRILAMASPILGAEYSIWASDDTGATWFRYAAPGDTGGIVFTAGTEAQWRLEYYRGDLAFFRTTTVERLEQWASSDLGQTFSFVATDTSIGSKVSAKALPNDAGIVVGYIGNAASYPMVRIISGAFAPYTSATEITVEAVAIDEMAVSVDGVGNIWVHGTLTATPETVAVWVSEDNGLTFARCEDLWDSQTTGTYLTNLSAVFVRGWCVLSHNWATATTTAPVGSIGSLWAGGWSSFGSNTANSNKYFEERTSWTTVVGVGGQTGIPIELPSSMTGWLLVGGAPTLQSPGELEFNTAAANSKVQYLLTTGSIVAGFEAYILSGNGSSIADEVFHSTIMRNAVDYQIDSRLDAANGRIRFRDSFGAATIGNLAVDVTIPIQVVVCINGVGQYIIIYKRPWATRWQRAFESQTPLTAGASANVVSKAGFGHGNTGTNVSRWRQWPMVNGDFNASEFGIGWTPGEEFGYLDFGGPVTGNPRPIPEIGSESAAAFISIDRGPARMGETFSVVPTYDFGVDRIFADISPSRDEPFRSEDDASVVTFVWDAGDAISLGMVWQLAFTLLNVNFKTATIDANATGAGWVNAGTYNGAEGFEALTFSRTGKFIRPAAGTADAARVIRRNELAGGFAIFAGNVTAKIVGNSPGSWTDPSATTTVFPEIQLDDVTTVPTSGTCDLVFPNGCLVVEYTGAQPAAYARYWRLSVPVQDNPDGYIQIGNFAAATVAVFGKQWSRGWSRAMIPNTSRRVSRYGTVRKRQQGPPARRWSMSWADGVNEGKIRGNTSPDYLGQSGGTPLAVRDDVWTLLYGLLEETNGGQAPVTALANIPSGTATITDRTLFLFGTWDSSVQANQVEGAEGVNEFFRVEPIRIEEIR